MPLYNFNHFLVLILFSISINSCSGKRFALKADSNSSNVPLSELANKTKETTFESTLKISSIFQDSQNNYWFGTDEQGLYQYNGKDYQLYTVKDGLCPGTIIGIQEDKYGHIYIDTDHGVCKFDGNQFSFLEPITTQTDDWRLEEDDLWFKGGWNKKGPYRWDGTALIQLHFPKSDQEERFYSKYPNVSFSPYGIYSMYKDSRNAIWFGTSSFGVCRFDGETIQWIFEDQMTTTPDGGAFGIRTILEDNKGLFWFTNSAYSYAIQAQDSQEKESNLIQYKRHKGLPYINENKEAEYPYFLSSTIDKGHHIWMVSFDEGIWENDGKKLIHHSVLHDNKQIILRGIYKDKTDKLWLISQDHGLYTYNGMAFEPFKL